MTWDEPPPRNFKLPVQHDPDRFAVSHMLLLQNSSRQLVLIVLIQALTGHG